MSEMASEPMWSDLQVSYLQALGHTVYLDRDTVDALPAPAEVVERAGSRADARRAGDAGAIGGARCGACRTSHRTGCTRRGATCAQHRAVGRAAAA